MLNCAILGKRMAAKGIARPMCDAGLVGASHRHSEAVNIRQWRSANDVAKTGVRPSTGPVGDAYDDAMAESFLFPRSRLSCSAAAGLPPRLRPEWLASALSRLVQSGLAAFWLGILLANHLRSRDSKKCSPALSPQAHKPGNVNPKPGVQGSYGRRRGGSRRHGDGSRRVVRGAVATARQSHPAGKSAWLSPAIPIYVVRADATYHLRVSQGVRLTDGSRIMGGWIVEFGGLTAPANESRAQFQRRDLAAVFRQAADLRAVSSWMGHRPCLPDFLPVIGQASDGMVNGSDADMGISARPALHRPAKLLLG